MRESTFLVVIAWGVCLVQGVLTLFAGMPLPESTVAVVCILYVGSKILRALEDRP